jgi:hypothetical protein
MAHTRGFFQRALDRPRKRPLVDTSTLDEDLERDLDWSNSQRERYEEAGNLASWGGLPPRHFGFGVGRRGVEWDAAAAHAAVIRGIARFGLHDHTRPEPWVEGDEFAFEGYPHGVATWSEDHPSLWNRWRDRVRQRRAERRSVG